MKQNNNSILEVANSEYQSANFRKARFLFRQLVKEDPQFIKAKAGLIISLTRFLEFKEAEELLNTIDDSTLPDLDELSRFRIIYSKARVLHAQKKIQDGLIFLDYWMSNINSIYQPILSLEKASFLVLENKYSEALDFIIKSNGTLKPELRAQTIGRIIYILMDMNERSLALRFALEDFMFRPSLSKIIQIILLGIIGNPFYLSIMTSVWLIIWFLIPINVLSIGLLIPCGILFGIVPIIAFITKAKGIRNYLIAFWLMTIAMYLLKTLSVPIQVAALIGFIIVHLLLLLTYKSLFRKEGKGHTKY